ncbi:unnamed protein product [Phytophthora fragariaefolia]|uniref:Unnamed protein product n=1 Tax=Phytophthora fragariaefolia TaxID=1490495 RepID=A0A9W6XKL5_9STRA|nr:unnamed protein product [Phytophthora fragariaefolia]
MATIARFVAAENKISRGETAASPAEPPAQPRETVRKYGNVSGQIITERNISGKPVTSQHIADVARGLTGEAISAHTVRRTLRAINCSFKVGVRRDILADSDANAAFRLKYLQRKRANLNKRTAIRTEVYLGESYCNPHHVAKRTWLLPEIKRVVPSVKGWRFCIIGAGAITRVGNNRTRGNWVSESVKMWAADKAASAATDD